MQRKIKSFLNHFLWGPSISPRIMIFIFLSTRSGGSQKEDFKKKPQYISTINFEPLLWPYNYFEGLVLTNLQSSQSIKPLV